MHASLRVRQTSGTKQTPVVTNYEQHFRRAHFVGDCANLVKTATMASGLEEATARLARLSCSTTTGLKRARNSHKNRRISTRIQNDTVLVFARDPLEEKHNTEHDELHFLGLPAELRDEIYKHVAADYLATVGLQKKPQPALLGVSKQIRREFSSIFHHRNFFVIAIWDHRVGSWIEVKDERTIEAIMHEKMGIRFWRVQADSWSWSRLCAMNEVMDTSPDDDHKAEEVFLTGVVKLRSSETELSCDFHRVPVAMFEESK